MCVCVCVCVCVYFADISIQSTLHNRAEAQMFAHPNNEGIWRKEKVLLLVGVEGHQQASTLTRKHTHGGCRLHTGRHATVDTNTRGGR